ncbi:MAG: quinolinate synthase NadA [Bacteroidales bacterium]|jgi:quinolinate synthase|nr:quinolinate synthase NadA [Bacteroidales bacterium]
MLINEILELKKSKNALILAHYYQEDEIQDIADFIGDSLALADKAQNVDNDIIVFCGVHFMAETAKILNLDKKILLPDLEAGCSLADSCPADRFKEFKKNYPDHFVVSYINCTAEMKTLSDLICTSGNAVQLINALPKDLKIIFAPDKNLGAYVMEKTGREMVLWNGTCHVHDQLKTEYVINLKMQYPDAKVVAHPECDGPVLALADFIGSTNAMLKYVKQNENKQFIVASETGILYQMQKNNPKKEFYVVPVDETCACNDCKYMKLNTLEKIRNCLRDEKPQIFLDRETIKRARKPLELMLDISKELRII